MLSKINRKMKKEDGFTLVELIIVITVLGILAAITIPRITDIRTQAQISSARTILRNTVNEIETTLLNDETINEYSDITDGETYPNVLYEAKTADGENGFVIQYDQTIEEDHYYIDSDNMTIETSATSQITE